MRRFHLAHAPNSFKSKLLLSYLLLILLPIALCSILITRQVMISYREATDTLVRQRLDQEANGIAKTLDAVEQVAWQLSANATLRLFLNIPYDPTNMDVYQQLTYRVLPIFTWVTNANPNLRRINVLTCNDSISEIEMFVHADKHADEAWFVRMRGSVGLGRSYWESCHVTHNYGRYDQSAASSVPVYSLFTEMDDLRPRNATFLELEVKPDMVFGTLRASSIGKSGSLYAIDSDGEIICGTMTPLMQSLLTDPGFASRLKSSESSYRATVDRQGYNIEFKRIERLDTALVGIIPTSELSRVFSDSIGVYIVVLALALVFLIVLAYAFGNSLSRKISIIAAAFRRFQSGDFHVRIPVRGADELDQLCGDFNAMASETGQLIDRVYKSEIAQKQAELNALQAQINPHFINNTLESLKMLAELHDEEQISDGLTALGHLMRLNTYGQNQMIALSAELENLNDYVHIQNLNHNNRISLTCGIPDELLEAPIQNLLLQPIVENSIRHGLKEGRGHLRLRVTACVEPENDAAMTLSICDDGCGIPAGRLEQLRSRLRQHVADGFSAASAGSSDGSFGIGLVNVNRRIKLHDGEAFGLELVRSDAQGTDIQLRLPLERSDACIR